MNTAVHDVIGHGYGHFVQIQTMIVTFKDERLRMMSSYM